MLKITRAHSLIQSNLCYLELDGMQVGTVYAFAGCYDRIREALEEREATPEESYLLEEQGRELAKAELLIEKLKEEVGHWEEDFSMFDRAHEKAINLWRKEHPDARFTPDMSDLNEWLVWRVEKAEAALRTAEESSVVRLIDSTPAKQPEDSANTDGDGDILNDIETSLRAKTDGMKRLLESQTLSPELAALGRELVRLAEKSLGEVES